jgi:hypothetical protein
MLRIIKSTQNDDFGEYDLSLDSEDGQSDESRSDDDEDDEEAFPPSFSGADAELNMDVIGYVSTWVAMETLIRYAVFPHSAWTKNLK